MSLRRGKTVSPLIGWPTNASPSAVQSLSVPVSKSKLSGLPSAPVGRTPSLGVGFTGSAAETEKAIVNAKHNDAATWRMGLPHGWRSKIGLVHSGRAGADVNEKGLCGVYSALSAFSAVFGETSTAENAESAEKN